MNTEWCVFMQAQQECEEVQRKHAEAPQDLQQRRCLNDLVLERKIKSVTESLREEQLKLWVALAFRLGDQTAANNIEVPPYIYTLSACVQ